MGTYRWRMTDTDTGEIWETWKRKILTRKAHCEYNVSANNAEIREQLEKYGLFEEGCVLIEDTEWEPPTAFNCCVCGSKLTESNSQTMFTCKLCHSDMVVEAEIADREQAAYDQMIANEMEVDEDER